jgi:protein-S-isoprenylcysteine O-methyltransferase Ste14
VLTIVDRGVIAREERYLTERFGQSYTDYCANVRRWI